MLSAPATPTAWKRVNGGFRRMAVTELGDEQMCMSCQELWPLDQEFFLVSGSGVSYECKACIAERRAAHQASSGARPRQADVPN